MTTVTSGFDFEVDCSNAIVFLSRRMFKRPDSKAATSEEARRYIPHFV
jgi:hypothetical protein